MKSSYRTHTKEEYEKALLFRKQGKTHLSISNELNINIHTIQSWFYLPHKPHCISKTWKEFNKRRAKNLGKHIERNPIDVEGLTKPEQAYLLGAYLGDGNSYNGFDMQVKDINFAAYVAELISKVSKTETTAIKYERIRKRGIEKGFRVRVSNLNLKDWLELTTDHKKKIPTFKTIKEIWWLLSGLIDSEGSIGKVNRVNTSVKIEISQKDENLLKQLQKVIERIGIKSSVSIDYKVYFKLFIYSKIHFERLLKEGNLKIEYKRNKLEYSINNGIKGYITQRSKL